MCGGVTVTATSSWGLRVICVPDQCILLSMFPAFNIENGKGSTNAYLRIGMIGSKFMESMSFNIFNMTPHVICIHKILLNMKILY